MFSYHFTIISCLKYTVNSYFHLIQRFNFLLFHKKKFRKILKFVAPLQKKVPRTRSPGSHFLTDQYLGTKGILHFVGKFMVGAAE